MSAISTDNNQIIDDQGNLDEEENHNKTNTNGAAKKPESRRGKLIVQSFQLARNCKPPRKFGCVGCPLKFGSNKELNDHFKSTHPLLTCSDCCALFTTPCAFEKTQIQTLRIYVRV